MDKQQNFQNSQSMFETEDGAGLKIMSGIYWDRGRRFVNQDSLTLQQALTERGRVMLAAVSDGIGGLSEGENASGFITERLAEHFYRELAALAGKKRGRKAIKRSLLRCFYEMNGQLRHYGAGKEIRLGATISLLFLWGRRYVIFHLGDSRIYLCSRRGTRLLTRDHGTGGGVTRCMGSFTFQYPDIYFGRVHGRSGFLLCTDGFYRTLDKEALRALAPGDIAGEEQIGRRLRTLGMEAEKKGEQDNMSAVYCIAYREVL